MIYSAKIIQLKLDIAVKEHTKDSHKMVNDASMLLHVHGILILI